MLVCLYPTNVKTAEPIGPKFCVGPHMTPGKVYKLSKFKKFASNKIRFLINSNHGIFLIKSANLFFIFVLHSTNRKCLQLQKKIKSLILYCTKEQFNSFISKKHERYIWTHFKKVYFVSQKHLYIISPNAG